MKAGLALGVLLLAPACGEAQAPPTFSSAVEGRVPGLLARHRVPGAAIALVEEGALAWTGTFGVAVVETATPVQASTVFQVASLSKSLTAWGALRLAEQGRLDLDAPVARHLSRWRLPGSAFDAGGVTARRILSHRAGLSVHGYLGYRPDQALPSLVQSLSGETGYPVALVRPPGAAAQYSGGGFTVLQLAIEEIAGEPFADHMRREVLQPLGMTASAFAWEPGLRPSTAGAYGADVERLPNFLFTEQAAAGLYTTIEDLGRFVAASVSGREVPGRGVVSLQAVAAMHAEVGGGFGLGHEVYAVGAAGPAVGHGGVNVGWRAHWSAVPDRGRGIAVLANSENADPLVLDVVCLWYREEVGSVPGWCPA
jgi:CubicO group peptidase (beta-lactamase class C family)